MATVKPLIRLTTDVTAAPFISGGVYFDWVTLSYYRASSVGQLTPLRVQGVLTPTETGATLTCIDGETKLTHAEAWQELVQYPNMQVVTNSNGEFAFLLII